LNLERVLAIELFNAAQALHFRRPGKSSAFLEQLVASYREEVPFVENDTIMHTEMLKSVSFLRNYKLEIPNS